MPPPPTIVSIERALCAVYKHIVVRNESDSLRGQRATFPFTDGAHEKSYLPIGSPDVSAAAAGHESLIPEQ